MTPLPLVSIVIPSFNHKDYVTLALRSVLEQTYDAIEVILVDDCSQDGTPEIIRDYISRIAWRKRFENRTRFFPLTANIGAHAAINMGLKAATGDILTILNSDDRYAPERIETLVNIFQEKKASLVFTGVELINAEDRPVEILDDYAHTILRYHTTIRNFPTYGFACMAGNITISSGNLAFSTKLYDHVGAFEAYKYCHDWDFLLRSIFYTEPHFCDQALYYYRLHGSNTVWSVQEMGRKETEAIYGKFFRRVHTRRPVNPLCPSPWTWPVFFEQFLEYRNLREFYEEANSMPESYRYNTRLAAA